MKHNAKLRRGDFEQLANITGFSVAMVVGVVNGYRNNAKISKAIDAFIEAREALEDDLKSQFQPQL